jgi:hypothetical protein
VREPGLILGRAERVEQRGLVSRAERFSQQEVREPVLILSHSKYTNCLFILQGGRSRKGMDAREGNIPGLGSNESTKYKCKCSSGARPRCAEQGLTPTVCC